jgi:uncharacterized protein YbjT (DUF2867 family)
MKPILVTGATGTVGREVVAQLLAAGAPVRALTRNPEAAGLPSGAEVVQGDLAVPESLEAGLAGIETVFFVWTAPAEAAPDAVARLARQARHLVYLTAPHRTPHPFFQQPNPMAAMHAEIERTIEASGLSWTFLRPGMFAANVLGWWAPQIRDGDVVRWPYAAAPTAPLDERDLAAVAVQTLLASSYSGADYAGADYVLTGPESLDQREQVRTIGEELGRPLRFEEIAPEEMEQVLPAPASIRAMLCNAWAAALGQPAFVTTTVEEITGRPARTFREWVRDHGDEFRRRLTAG